MQHSSQPISQYCPIKHLQISGGTRCSNNLGYEYDYIVCPLSVQSSSKYGRQPILASFSHNSPSTFCATIQPKMARLHWWALQHRKFSYSNSVLPYPTFLQHVPSRLNFAQTNRAWAHLKSSQVESLTTSLPFWPSYLRYSKQSFCCISILWNPPPPTHQLCWPSPPSESMPTPYTLHSDSPSCSFKIFCPQRLECR